MCGRYSLGRNDRIDWGHFGVLPIPDLLGRWNIAPSQKVLAVRARSTDGRAADPTATPNEATWLKWGLIPFWAKDPSIGAKLMNARSDTAAEKPSFRAAFKARRCLLPADGFYEWETIPGARKKQPWRVEAADGTTLALGAIWERWKPPEGDPVETCTILTVDVNESLRHIHDRLPVLIGRDDYTTWLDPKTPLDTVQGLCRSPAEHALTAWRVADPRDAEEPARI